MSLLCNSKDFLQPYNARELAETETENRYARSAQWYHKRPNRTFTPFEKFCFKYIPFYQRLNRLSIFLEGDRIVDTYVGTEKAAKLRASVEKEAAEYILEHTPKKYHSFIVPDFPLGESYSLSNGISSYPD